MYLYTYGFKEIPNVLQKPDNSKFVYIELQVNYYRVERFRIIYSELAINILAFIWNKLAVAGWYPGILYVAYKTLNSEHIITQPQSSFTFKSEHFTERELCIVGTLYHFHYACEPFLLVVSFVVDKVWGTTTAQDHIVRKLSSINSLRKSEDMSWAHNARSSLCIPIK